MTPGRTDWSPVSSGALKTSLQIFAGLASSFALFLLVAWTISDQPPPPEETIAPNRLTSAPLPPPELEQETSNQSSNTPRPISKPVRFAQETFKFELSPIDVDFNPRQSIDTLAKIDVDISQIKMSHAEIEDMVVYERSELDKGLVAIYQPMPSISKRTKQKQSVRLLFVVDANGKVTDEIYVLESTDPEINADVILGVKSWSFRPPIREGEKVRAKVRIRINISPQNQSPFSL